MQTPIDLVNHIDRIIGAHIDKHLHYLGTRLQKTHTPSTRWLQENVRYASFDDDLWILLQNETMRKRLHNYIIESKLPDAHDGWISKAADGFSLLAGLLLAVA
jgi:hypothetical protein